jgi:hypothetical protein
VPLDPKVRWNLLLTEAGWSCTASETIAKAGVKVMEGYSQTVMVVVDSMLCECWGPCRGVSVLEEDPTVMWNPQCLDRKTGIVSVGDRKSSKRQS